MVTQSCLRLPSFHAFSALSQYLWVMVADAPSCSTVVAAAVVWVCRFLVVHLILACCPPFSTQFLHRMCSMLVCRVPFSGPLLVIFLIAGSSQLHAQRCPCPWSIRLFSVSSFVSLLPVLRQSVVFTWSLSVFRPLSLPSLSSVGCFPRTNDASRGW